MDRVPADRIVERLEVSYYVGMMEHLLECDEDAARHLEQTLAGAQETGKTFVLAPAGAVLAQARLRRGQVAEAAEAAADAVDAARLTGNPQSVTQALAAHSRALLVAGELREAVAAAEESVRLTAPLEPSAMAAVPALALGAALLELGRPDDAAAAVLGTARLPLVPGTTGCEAHELLVRAALAAGRHDEAERIAARAEARAERVELPVTRAQAGRARALVALDAGDARGAAGAALAAAASAGAVGAVLEEARARLLAGAAKAAGGERASAVAELTAARETFAACGARRLGDATAQELRRLGERVPRRTLKPDGGQGLAGLTAREREIAQLVNDGRMNREIAAELFLSEKTVETHLRNIFAKLGVASRADVAATVRRQARG
jgi:DNA-binding NarL/FixJ family response regulator